jgi:autotransporter translocation and assembly factor TamB
MKFLARFFSLILMLILSILFLILWIIYTSSGLSFAIHLLSPIIPGKLKIEKIQGSLAKNLMLNNIHYENKNISLSLNILSLEWNPELLFTEKTLKIFSLKLDGLSFVNTTPESESRHSSSFYVHLPHQWLIENLELKNINYNHITIPDSLWKIDAQTKNNTAIINQLSGKILHGTLNIYGDVHIKTIPEWKINLEAKNLDPHQLKPETSGNISFNLFTLKQQNNVTINLSDLSGKLNNLPLKGEGVFISKNNIYKIPKLNIYSGSNNYIKAKANIAQTAEAEWRIFIKNTADILPSTSGKLISNGLLSGTIQNQEANLGLRNFSFSHPSIGKWTITAPAYLKISPDQISLHSFKLIDKARKAYFNINGEWHKNKNWSLQEKGNFYIEPLNITLNPFEVTMSGNPKQIIYSSHILSGNGSVKVEGKANLSSAPISLTTTISGNNFLAVNTSEYKALASPSLTLEKKEEAWYLKGKLFIPMAQINSPNYSQKAVVLSKDVIIEDEKNSQQKNNFGKFYSDIELILGKNIYVQAENLEAHLNGRIRLNDAPEHPTVGNGKLIITDGAYHAYGQNLEIHNGQLLFNNNAVTNPNLEIQASKKVTLSNEGSMSTALIATNNAQARVGVNVAGTLEDPQMTLFSSAPLSQADILSYLLFGKATNEVSAGDAALLLRSASAINIGNNQVEGITRSIKNASSLDQFGIESTHYVDPSTSSLKENTSLVLGKALSPKLYVSYSLGILQPINVLTVQYFITKKWSVQSTNSSLASGVDLFYKAERK